MKKSKRGQLLGQPFIYIFAIIVAALVLVFGTKAILDLKEKQELAELATFVTSLKEEVAAYYRFDIGSSKELELNLPLKVKKVCFYENELRVSPEVFVINKFKIPYLKPIESPLCIITNGKLKAIIETKAKYVEIRVSESTTTQPTQSLSTSQPTQSLSTSQPTQSLSTSQPTQSLSLPSSTDFLRIA